MPNTFILGDCPMCGAENVDVLADVAPERALCRDCLTIEDQDEAAEAAQKWLREIEAPTERKIFDFLALMDRLFPSLKDEK